jgi:endonuclease-3
MERRQTTCEYRKSMTKKKAHEIYAALQKRYPDATCALQHTSPFELLIATILSAQATDVSVNKASPALFNAFPTPKAFAHSSPEEIEPYIASIGLLQNDSKKCLMAKCPRQ